MIKLTIIGNLGRDAELKEVNGQHCISFSVADSQSYTNKDGQKVEKTTWVNCAIWRDKGQRTKIVEFLKKGTKVYIEGDLSVRTYKNADGVHMASIDCRVKDLQFVGAAKASDTTATNTTQVTPPPPSADDMPFDLGEPMPNDTEEGPY